MSKRHNHIEAVLVKTRAAFLSTWYKTNVRDTLEGVKEENKDG
ncbi:hypothetical protein ACNPNT_19055 [Bacillus safensis]